MFKFQNGALDAIYAGRVSGTVKLIVPPVTSMFCEFAPTTNEKLVPEPAANGEDVKIVNVPPDIENALSGYGKVNGA